MTVGLAMASLSTVAFAEPAAQAGPSATPTATAMPAAACVNPPQGVVVVVGNPNPGDVLVPGSNVVVQGIAYDTAATSGPGIDRVSVYLGDRDSGGLFWGDAALGLPNPQASSGPLASAGFSLRSPTIPAGSGSRTIFVYARSTVSNREGVASVPVFIGVAPTAVRGQVPTAVLPPPPACTPTPAPTTVPTSTSTPVPAAAAIPPTVAVPTPTPLAPMAIPAATLAPIPVAPAPAPTAAPAAVAPAAVAPGTATTAPRAGGVPTEVGVLLLAAGAVVVGGGLVARRRERRRGGAPRA
jgi:hypothetical protein